MTGLEMREFDAIEPSAPSTCRCAWGSRKGPPEIAGKRRSHMHLRRITKCIYRSNSYQESCLVQRPPRGIRCLESGIKPNPKLRQTFQTQGSVTSGHKAAGPSDKV